MLFLDFPSNLDLKSMISPTRLDSSSILIHVSAVDWPFCCGLRSTLESSATMASGQPKSRTEIRKEKLLSTSTLPAWTRSEPTIKQSLCLVSHSTSSPSCCSSPSSFPCVACDASLTSAASVLEHMRKEHALVLPAAHRLADLELYLRHWRRRVVEDSGDDYVKLCRKVKRKEEFVFCLRDQELQSDLDLKLQLQRRKLKEVLAVSERERGHDPSFRRECLFCRQVFEHRIHDLIDHLAFDHNFSVGRPSNLVFIEELLDTLQSRLEQLICIYCERVFKSREVLKEHMRKKGHKRIDPENESYDKFYLINYIDHHDHVEDEDEWQVWRDEHEDEDEEEEDEQEDPLAFCLFCSETFCSMGDLLNHMCSVHNFDFRTVRNTLKLDFYAQVKLVNFIRRKVFLSTCICCGQRFDNRAGLLEHMERFDHFELNASDREWEQQQFLFPTYENDVFISMLDDDIFENQEQIVIPEDVPLLRTELAMTVP